MLADMCVISPTRQILLSSLRREVSRLESARPPEDEQSISTVSPALDRLLPTGGFKRGTLVEYLSPASGSGAGTLALAAAREACQEGKALIVVGTGAPAQRVGVPLPENRSSILTDGTRSVPTT